MGVWCASYSYCSLRASLNAVGVKLLTALSGRRFQCQDIVDKDHLTLLTRMWFGTQFGKSCGMDRISMRDLRLQQAWTSCHTYNIACISVVLSVSLLIIIIIVDICYALVSA